MKLNECGQPIDGELYFEDERVCMCQSLIESNSGFETGSIPSSSQNILINRRL